MKVRADKMLVYIMAIGSLFPCGLGLDVGGEGLTSSKLSLALLLGLMLIVIFNRRQVIFFANYPDKLMLNFIGWVLFNGVMAGLLNLGSIREAAHVAISALIWVLAYFPFYFIGRLVPSNITDIHSILKGVHLILVICALIGMVEFVFETNYYGELGRLLGLKDMGSGAVLWRGSVYRIRSSLDQSISFGFAMACGYVLTDYLMKVSRLKFCRMCKFAFIVTTLLSVSRSAIFVLFICMGFLNIHKMEKAMKWFVIILSIAPIFWFVNHIDNFFYVDESLLSGEGTFFGQSGNLIGRYADFIFVQNVLGSYPVFGIGTGVLHDLTAFASYYPKLYLDYDNALDNMALAILVESGFVGLIMAAVAIAALFLYAFRLNDCPERYFILLTVFLFLTAALSYDVLIFPGTGRLMLLLIALSVSLGKLQGLKVKV